jgi:capsular polysaccharide biosynthesis protein
MQPEKPRRNTWYLLPILLGLVGGIIAYVVLRHDDPIKAKNCLYIGIGMAVLGILINILMLSQIPNMKPGFNVHI